MALQFFTQKDIEQMDPSQVSERFINYFNGLSQQRKEEIVKSNPLLAESLAFVSEYNMKKETVNEIEIEHAVQESEELVGKEIKRYDLEEQVCVICKPQAETLEEISNNVYEGQLLGEVSKDIFPLHLLVISDSARKCLIHRCDYIEKQIKYTCNKGVYSIIVRYCPKCNRLYINQSKVEDVIVGLKRHNIDYKVYDYEMVQRYFKKNIKRYTLRTDESIYYPDVWIEENPVCPIHENPLYLLPFALKHKNRTIEFEGYYCFECDKILLRRVKAAEILDECDEVGIPSSFKLLEKTKPAKQALPPKLVRPNFYVENGRKHEFVEQKKLDCYQLQETDTIIVSDSIYCQLNGHKTEDILALIKIDTKKHGVQNAVLLMGYCDKCQKYYVEEDDYKVVYGEGRPCATILVDSQETYNITSGEVFNLEKKKLDGLENKLEHCIEDIKSQKDYISQYAVGEYGEGGLHYAKAKSREKYLPELNELDTYRNQPYLYRVDLASDKMKKIFYLGATDIVLEKEEVISFNSELGRKMVNYRTNSVLIDNQEYSVKLSRRFDIEQANLFSYENIRSDEEMVFRKGITDPFLVKVLNMRKQQNNLIDIIATIQENQNSIVDEDYQQNLIVQGCAGSGKTMVLLHRLSQIKYLHPEFDFENAVILTPNEQFSLHIKGVANSLQIGNVERASLEQYYNAMLELYNSKLPIKGKLLLESKLNVKFVDYVYSNAFLEQFEEVYIQKISVFNQYIISLNEIVMELKETEKSIATETAAEIVPQIIKELKTYEAKVISLEEKITQEREKAERIRRQLETVKNKHEQAQNELDQEMKNQVSVVRAALSIYEKKLNSEIEAYENDISSVVSQLEEVINRDEKDVMVSQNILIQRIYDTLENDNNYLEEVMQSEKKEVKQLKCYWKDIIDNISISIENQIDEERKLCEALNIQKTEKSNQVRKIERTIIVFGKRQKMEAINKELKGIDEEIVLREEKIIFLQKGTNFTINDIKKEGISWSKDVLDNYLVGHNKNEKVLSVMGKMKESIIKVEQIENKVNEVKKNIDNEKMKLQDIRVLEEKERNLISALKSSLIQKEDIKNTSELDILEVHMKEIVQWLNHIGKWIPESLGAIKVYENGKNRIKNLANECENMEREIEQVSQVIAKQVKIKYPETTVMKIKKLKIKIEKYTTEEMCNSIFDEVVQGVIKQNNMSIPMKKYRYDLYVRLLFAMKYYNKKLGTSSFLFVDESQDIAVNEYKLLNDINKGQTIFNLYGDTNQLLKFGRGIDDWKKLEEIFNPKLFRLNENYRNTNQITKFCNMSFDMEVQATGVDGPVVREIRRRELEEDLSNLNINKQRIAILLPQYIEKKDCLEYDLLNSTITSLIGEEIDNGKISLKYVDEVKGVEFERVYVIPSNMEKNEKYIAYTRALVELVIVVDDGIV